MIFIQALYFINMVAFFIYGILCVSSPSMDAEFERYGLPHFRVFVGICEILGAVGLLVGYYSPLILSAASFCLAVLMVLGTYTRIRIKDSITQTLPAAVLMIINIFIFYYYTF